MKKVSFLENIKETKGGKLAYIQTSEEYCYLLVSPIYYPLLSNYANSGKLVPQKYGKVLYRGPGYPPLAVKRQVASDYA